MKSAPISSYIQTLGPISAESMSLGEGGQDLRVYKALPHFLFWPYFLCVEENVIGQLPGLAT